MKVILVLGCTKTKGTLATSESQKMCHSSIHSFKEYLASCKGFTFAQFFMQERGHVEVQVVSLALDRHIGLWKRLPKPCIESFHTHTGSWMLKCSSDEQHT